MARKAPKAAPAKAATANPAEAPPRAARSLVWLQGLVCGGLVACAPATAFLLAWLLAPALATLAFEGKPGRPVARTMLLFGASGAVFPTISLWDAGQTIGAAFSLAFDPRNLAIAWVAAGVGWLLTELVPVVVRLALASTALARKRRLRALRDRCAAEWGLEPIVEPK